MKMKKITILLIAFILALLVSGNVYAADSMYIKPILARKEVNGNQYGYKYGAGGSTSNVKMVWKLVETNSSGQITASAYDKNLFCLRGGYGFYKDSMQNGEEYTAKLSFWNSNNKDEIIKKLYGTTTPSTYYSKFNFIMWILKNAYTPDKGAEYKKALLNEVYEYDTNESKDHFWSIDVSADLTDDDIDVVQQIALWYFTENTNGYQVDSLPELQIQNTTLSSTNWNPISDYDTDSSNTQSSHRSYQTKKLYQYLISKAQEQGNKDQITTTTVENLITIENKDQITTTTDSNLGNLVGPIVLKNNSTDITAYTLSMDIVDATNNTSITDYKLYVKNENGTYTEISKDNVKEAVGKQIYVSLGTTVTTEQIKVKVQSEYTRNKMDLWYQTSNNAYQPVVEVGTEKVQNEDSTTIRLKVPDIDLALRKSITKVGEKTVTDRLPDPDVSNLIPNGTDTTAKYNHPKNDVEVSYGDIIEYTLTIYNEGQVNAYAAEIKDYLPAGIEFIEIVEKDKSRYEASAVKDQTTGKTVVTITNKQLKENAKIDKFTGGTSLDSDTVTIRCKITAQGLGNEPRLVNIAEITKYYNVDEDKETDIDRDSEINNFPDSKKNNKYDGKDNDGSYWEGQEDDDDFEPVTLREIDLALRKSITKVGEKTVTDRLPDPDVSNLIPNGTDTTAKYNHPKNDVEVKTDDTIEYTLTIYNEGPIDGYAANITDYLPNGIEFISISDKDANRYKATATKNENGTTKIELENLEKKVLKAFDGETLESDTVTFVCKITAKASSTDTRLVNIAEITKYHDSEKDRDLDIDRDSETVDNGLFPDSKKNNEYKGNGEDGNYVKGQQDDDDFEPVILKPNGFDLALRKFITQVNGEDVTPSREPVFSGEINESTHSWRYDHTKDPVLVKTGDIVTYTLRIYNEGTIDGYAQVIADDLPEGIEFLPTNTINTTYGWKMYDKSDKETTDLSKAVRIKTDYLSKANETSERSNLIKAFDQDTMKSPDYKDVQIAFKVTEPNTSDRIVKNSAQIVDDADKDGNEIDDVDSIPDEWKGEDDEDVDYIKVQYFDLALRKWVTQVVLVEGNKTTVTNTGHQAEDDPEEVVKVDLLNRNLDSVVVKFAYKIKVTNEGEIAGYVGEIKDYIPDGLKFVAADNPQWTQVSDNVVTTDQAKDILLQPNDTVTVDIVLTWINGEDNLGLKVNTAEISKDSDDDIDSTPDNQKDGEDDIDTAPVMLSLVTGKGQTYIGLIAGVLVIIAGGVILIKKYVID